MADEEKVEQDGTWTGLKKTIIGTLSTLILGGGTYLGTVLFGGGNDKEETKTEQVAPAPVIVNVQNNNTQQQKQSAGNQTIIREKVIEKQAAPAPAPKPEKKSETEDAPW
jgi:hypothetical protein